MKVRVRVSVKTVDKISLACCVDRPCKRQGLTVVFIRLNRVLQEMEARQRRVKHLVRSNLVGYR